MSMTMLKHKIDATIFKFLNKDAWLEFYYEDDSKKVIFVSVASKHPNLISLMWKNHVPLKPMKVLATNENVKNLKLSVKESIAILRANPNIDHF